MKLTAKTSGMIPGQFLCLNEKLPHCSQLLFVVIWPDGGCFCLLHTISSKLKLLYILYFPLVTHHLASKMFFFLLFQIHLLQIIMKFPKLSKTKNWHFPHFFSLLRLQKGTQVFLNIWPFIKTIQTQKQNTDYNNTHESYNSLERNMHIPTVAYVYADCHLLCRTCV